jgi:hypothetical protein
MSLAKHEFTNAGRSMLGRAQAGEVLTITKIVVGSGGATTPDQLWPLTALIAKEMDVTISAKNDYGQGTLLVEGSFLSSAAPHAFQLREVGVMAHIGAEADRLYSVGNALTDPPDTIDPASPSLQAFKVKLVIDRIPATSLVIQIGPSENVVGQNLSNDTVGPGVYKDAAGNILSFKRLAAGSGIELVEDAAQTYITIGTKILKVDLDVYVPANHPNCPDASVGFPTIQAAHDFLLQYRIPAGRTARINIWSGTFTQASINFNHPDCQQIQVIGWPRVSYNVTRVDPISATQKKVTLDTTTHGLQVNNVVYLPDSVLYYIGGCKVLSAPAGMNYVNVSVPYRGNRGASNPYNTAYVAAHHMRRYTTIVAFNDANKQVCWNFPYGIGSITNVLVLNTAGTLGGYGMAIAGAGGSVVDCQIMGPFRRGISGGGDIVMTGGEMVITDCDFGITGFSPFWLAVSSGPGIKAIQIINGCGNGFSPGTAAGAVAALIGGMPDVIAYISHCQNGVFVTSGGQMSGGAILIDTCDTALAAFKGATIVVGTGTNQSCYMYNNTTDLSAQGMAYIEYHYANNGNQNPICNPPEGAPGNQNSYIHVTA